VLQDQLRQIQDSLIATTRQSRATTEIGGFIALLDPSDPLTWINWAAPIGKVSEEDVDALVAHFRAHARLPRLEFFVDLWPEAYRMLLDYGFEIEKEMPIMVLHSQDWIPSETRVVAVDGSVNDLREVKRVLDVAFGMDESDDPPSASVIEGLESGRYYQALVRLESRVAGAGYAVGDGKVREIAGIGTASEFRRRGIATAVIDRLLQRFFSEGGEVAWLTPGDDGAQALYERLGFRSVGTQACLVFNS
jgi:ribosomal protein S18 acetylase RimI-like enzyme